MIFRTACPGTKTAVAFPISTRGNWPHRSYMRGPQGTLYGHVAAGSGCSSTVTIDPSTDAASGRIQVGASDVYNGNNPGYNVRAAANVPVSDTLAVRASGFTREDSGYVNNIQTAERGVNQAKVDGGRALDPVAAIGCIFP